MPCDKPCVLFLGEMWIGITLAIVVELVPSNIRTSAVAVYLFIISNIGGNMPLLVPPIREAFLNNGASKAEALRGKTTCESVFTEYHIYHMYLDRQTV